MSMGDGRLAEQQFVRVTKNHVTSTSTFEQLGRLKRTAQTNTHLIQSSL